MPTLNKVTCLRCLAGFFLVVLSGLAHADTWAELSPEQHQILAPLAVEWNTLSERQHKNFLGIAKRFPSLNPQQQKRATERLVHWSKLTPAQRQQAREKYLALHHLPPDKREAIKKNLRERHAQKQASSAVPPASAVTQQK